jgi:DNA-binding winged helix-turn-helix (wHTH) protein/TolB-like protein
MSSEKLLYYDFNEYRLDVLNGKLLKDNKSIELTPKSLEILLYLIKNRGRLLRKKELLNALWSDTFVDESNLIQHIYLLRKVLKLNDNGDVLIETVPKTGYRFIGDVKEIFANEDEDRFVASPAEGHNPESASEQIVPVSPVSETVLPPVIDTLRPKKRRFWLNGLLALAFVLPLGIYLYFYQNGLVKSLARDNPTSIAVLPFHQIASNSDERIGLGIADVIIAQLAKLENVRITPTSSILQFAENKELDPFEAGNRLGVDFVLIGTIHRDGDDVRITYQVFHVKDKQTVISDKIDGKFSNNFSLQDAVSEQVQRQVSMTITHDKSLIIMNYQ